MKSSRPWNILQSAFNEHFSFIHIAFGPLGIQSSSKVNLYHDMSFPQI